jgi:hypothetical protein
VLQSFSTIGKEVCDVDALVLIVVALLAWLALYDLYKRELREQRHARTKPDTRMVFNWETDVEFPEDEFKVPWVLECKLDWRKGVRL